MDGRTAAVTRDQHDHSLVNARPRALLLFAVALTLVTFGVELAGGLWSRSIALLSDAGHVFMDLTALTFSLFAMSLAERPANDRRTFGLHRLEVFAGFLNGLLVIAVAAGIAVESFSRFGAPVAPKVGAMLSLGAAGFLANLIVAWKLHAFSQTDLNIRSAFLHVATDALASLGVVAAGAAIALTGWLWVDPAMGLAIAAVILWNAVRLLRDSVNLLLEGVPAHLRLAEVSQALEAVPGVSRVEDLHLWGLCSHLIALSAHVRATPARAADQEALLKDLNDALRISFRITHTTFQIEPAEKL